MKSTCRRGFSLIEALTGLCILVVLLLGIVQMNAQSRHVAGDAVYELQAAQLAEEGIEILHAFGYDWVSRYAEHPVSGLSLTWAPIVESPVAGDEYPAEYRQFQRKVQVTPIETERLRACRIEVQVAPLPGTTAEQGLSRVPVTAETLVLEMPR